MGNTIPINRLGEFANKELETQYWEKHIKKIKKLIQGMVLLSGIVYFSIFIYDLFYYGSFVRALPSFISRALIFCISVVLFLVSNRVNNNRHYTLLISFYEICLVFSYFFILYEQRAQGYFQQGMVVIIFFLLIFLIPNRWIYCLITSAAALLVYFILTPFYIEKLQLFDIIEALIYQFIVFALISFYTFRNNFLQRTQFYREEQLQLLTITDELTDIYNRKKFDESLDEWISFAIRNNAVFCVIMYDLDDFKKLNDTNGHLAGDQTLVACANVVKANIRLMDVFARWGGEEFMILLPLTQLNNAADLAERLRIKISEIRIKGSISFTASFGVAEYRKNESRDSFLDRLDKKMYEAKQSGKNRVAY